MTLLSLVALSFSQQEVDDLQVTVFLLCPSFFTLPSFTSFSLNFLVTPSFVCFHVTNFATNIKAPQISELCQFCREYRNISNFAKHFWRKVENAKLKNTTNFRPLQILKCHKFQSAAKVSFYSSFFILLYYFYHSFVNT